LEGRSLDATNLFGVRQRSVSLAAQIPQQVIEDIQRNPFPQNADMSPRFYLPASLGSVILLSAIAPFSSASLRQASCDPSMWSHVYNPARLQKVKTCMTVSGVVDESTADEDGDQHFLLKLDAGQDQLLKKKNRKKKNGDLVVEIVCANHVKLKKAKAACRGYSNQIALPAVGAHLKVTGSYVIDTHNGWAEIHPVSRIDLIR
jgi:hypothetical protein